MDCLYKDTEFSRMSFCESDDCFCDVSIIVPDSKSDIAKIISVNATACVLSSRAEEGKVAITGQVKFNVLYIGESDNSPVCSITQTVPFSHIAISENVTSDFIAVSSLSGISCDYTPINSRKLKTSATLRLNVKAYRQHRLRVLTSAPSAQVRTSDITLDCAKVICEKSIAVTQSADLPAGKNAISQILRQSGKITDSEFKVLNNKLIIKGNILLSILYLSSSDICEATISMPYTEVVEAEGISPEYKTTLNVTVEDMEINPETDLSGEYKMLDATIMLHVSLLSFVTESFSAVTDLFLPRGAIKTDSLTLTSGSICEKAIEEEFVKETLTISKGQSPIRRIIDFNVTTGAVTHEVSDNSVVTVPMEISLLYFSEDSTLPVCSYTTHISVSHRFSSPVHTGVSAKINHAGYSLTDSETVEIRASVTFLADISEKKETIVFTNCEEADYSPEKRPSVIITFVKQGDSLYDIAKKYNIPISLLASANAIKDDEVLTVGEKLLIPR